MEIIISNFFLFNLSSPILVIIALVVTALCCFFATIFTLRSKSKPSDGGGISGSKRACGSFRAGETTAFLNGECVGGSTSGEEMVEKLAVAVPVERQTGLSMMEQLVPEITTHALSYLDYPSLCRLSMTNSLMRKAANDDNAWKALYHKDFTMEQDNVTPVNGWKTYYAATRAIVNVNSEFFRIIREKSIAEMGRFWLNSDYVKCFHASGEFFSGYSAVLQSWQLAFNWEQGFNFDIRDVRVRVLTDVAWVTMKAYLEVEAGSFIVTNVFEFHNGRWYMVHHHSSVMMPHGGAEQPMVQG